MDGYIEVEDADVTNGNMWAIAELLRALGFRAALHEIGDVQVVMSSTGGIQFSVATMGGMDQRLSMYLISASFEGVRASLADVNEWNRDNGVGPFAVIGEDGALRFAYPIFRGELSVAAFTGHLGHWLGLLERFGLWARNLQ